MERVEIICALIQNDEWDFIGPLLTCSNEEELITSHFSGSSVSSVVYSNKSEVTDLAEITALNFTYATMKFIPSGIKSYFINLKVLRISGCGLMSVNKANLKEYGFIHSKSYYILMTTALFQSMQICSNTTKT